MLLHCYTSVRKWLMFLDVTLGLVSLLTFCLQMQCCFEGVFAGTMLTSDKSSIHCNVILTAVNFPLFCTHFVLSSKQTSHELAHESLTIGSLLQHQAFIGPCESRHYSGTSSHALTSSRHHVVLEPGWCTVTKNNNTSTIAVCIDINMETKCLCDLLPFFKVQFGYIT